MKKDCDKYTDDLSAFIDGELTAAWRAKVEAHLAGCDDCRARVEQLRKLAAGIAAMPAAQPTPGFLADVRRRITEGELPRVENRWERAIRSPWVQIPVKVAAVLTIVVGFLSLFAPVYYARRERTDKTPMAKAEKPAAMAAPARSVAQAPAPRRPAAVAETKPPVGPSAVEAPAEQSKFDRSKEVGSETRAERIEVVSADPAEVRLRAMAVAAALNGRVLPAAEEVGAKFYVELPAGQVAAFRKRLLAERRSVTGEAGRFNDDGGRISPVMAGVATNEPVSVLEIQVVAPTK